MAWASVKVPGKQTKPFAAGRWAWPASGPRWPRWPNRECCTNAQRYENRSCWRRQDGRQKPITPDWRLASDSAHIQTAQAVGSDHDFVQRNPCSDPAAGMQGRSVCGQTAAPCLRQVAHQAKRSKPCIHRKSCPTRQTCPTVEAATNKPCCRLLKAAQRPGSAARRLLPASYCSALLCGSVCYSRFFLNSPRVIAYPHFSLVRRKYSLYRKNIPSRCASISLCV